MGAYSSYCQHCGENTLCCYTLCHSCSEKLDEESEINCPICSRIVIKSSFRTYCNLCGFKL